MTYAMGHTPRETDRLRRQAAFYAKSTDWLFDLAGIRPGMHVLDVGCGTGDMTLQLAERVGPTGSAMGIDADAGLLEVARDGAVRAGLRNASFQLGTVPDITLDQPVDALVGRLLLLHLEDASASLRRLSRLVRPGGVVSFQDINATRGRTAPPGPLLSRTTDWMVRALRAAGLTPDAGDRLPEMFREAGLTVTGMAVATPASANVNGGFPQYTADTFASLLPLVEKAGAPQDELAGVDTLAERIRREITETQAVMFLPELVGVWAELPR